MIELSNRMELMASFVDKGESVADIGTDHGLLPLSLWERGICPKVVMADVSKPSLEKAKINFIDFIGYDLPDKESKFSFVYGDGLKVIEAGSVDTITIAGMGGRLMVDILGADLKKTYSFKKFILQPRNGSQVLRQFLLESGFAVTTEALVEEGKYICEIIVAKPDKGIESSCGDIFENESKKLWPLQRELDSIVWELPILREITNQHLLEELTLRKLRKQRKILSTIMETSNKNKIIETEKNIRELERVIGERICK